MVVPNRHIASLAATTAGRTGRDDARSTRDAEMALTEAYQPAGHQRRHQPRPPGRRRHRRSHPHPPRAALDRRHEFHVGRRRARACCRRTCGKRSRDCSRFSSGSRDTANLRHDRHHAETQSTQKALRLAVCELVLVSMVLELSAEHLAFKQSIEQFAREVVAPRAAGIDEIGRVPARRDARGRRPRPARGDDSRASGAAPGSTI